MAATPLDREAILKAVEELPPAEQLEVAQRIMKKYVEDRELPQNQRSAPWVSWHALAGIALSPNQTPPSEIEIAEWLDERRMKEAE